MDCKSTNQNAVRRNQIYAYAHYSSHLLKSKVLGKNNLRTTFVLLNASYCERFFFSSRFYCCSFRATICMFHNYSRSVRRIFFCVLSRYSRINQCFVMLRSHIFETHSVYRPYYFDGTLSIYSLQNEHNWSAVLSIIFKRYFYDSCKIKNENLFECENIYWNNTVVAQDAYKRCIARHQLTLYNFHLFLCVFEPFIPCNARMLHEIDPHRFN